MKRLLFVAAALAACNKQAVDPTYVAALEAREKSVCECSAQEPPASLMCLFGANKANPEPAVPGGKTPDQYRESLLTTDAKKVQAITERITACQNKVRAAAMQWRSDMVRARAGTMPPVPPGVKAPLPAATPPTSPTAPPTSPTAPQP